MEVPNKRTTEQINIGTILPFENPDVERYEMKLGSILEITIHYIPGAGEDYLINHTQGVEMYKKASLENRFCVDKNCGLMGGHVSVMYDVVMIGIGRNTIIVRKGRFWNEKYDTKVYIIDVVH